MTDERAREGRPPEVAWVLRQVAVDDSGVPMDVAIDGDRIVAIAPSLPVAGRDEWTLRGASLLPALVETHAHLDRSLLGDLAGATPDEGRAAWRRERRSMRFEACLVRAEAGLRQALASGATTLRTHVEVDAETGMTALEAILEVRRQTLDVCDVQIVALGRPGGSARDEELLREALLLGADALGARPEGEPDPGRALRRGFDIAEAAGVPLDLHLGSGGGPEGAAQGVRWIEAAAREALARGLRGRLTLAPASALQTAPDDEVDRAFDLLADARAGLVALPSADLMRLGRGRGDAPRGGPRLREALARGLPVAAGAGAVRDPVHPFGSFDPLWNANLAAHVGQLASPRERADALSLVTTRAAEVLGLEGRGVHEGARADLLVLRARRPVDALATMPARLGVFRSGRLLMHNEVRRTWSEARPGWVY